MNDNDSEVMAVAVREFGTWAELRIIERGNLLKSDIWIGVRLPLVLATEMYAPVLIDEYSIQIGDLTDELPGWGKVG